ncbi:hypothetical protein UCD39_21000 [Nitrospirillum sp. BR 11752]|uniref:hypothetical protein n=1 Tax=Nitrospirillum sp. BR 11752 TaxID=3104293 RepID=UPI002E9FD334|nr:hypothetical protein [Nitrospirillum sp. BR 11752]
MGDVHLIVQRKAGTGKTTIATFLADYLIQRQRPGGSLLVLDTDTAHASLSRFPGLQARLVAPAELTDVLVPHRGDAVIDGGPEAHAAIMDHLRDDQTLPRLAQAGHALTVHCVVVGGGAQDDSLANLLDSIRTLPPSIRLIVWLNDYFGEIVSPTGQPFDKMRVYAEHHHRLFGLVTLRARHNTMFGRALQDMLKEGMTFTEAVPSPEFFIMERQRLVMMQREIAGLLDLVLLPNDL